MKINVTDLPTFSQPVVGNVYGCNGGYGRKAGHAMVLIAIIERNHDHNEDRYGDPDAAYDQWRDDEMMCLHEPGYGWDD